MYSVYLMNRKRKVFSEIYTVDRDEAIKAYEEKIYRAELYGRKILAVFKSNETIEDIHSFYEQVQQDQLSQKIEKIKANVSGAYKLNIIIRLTKPNSEKVMTYKEVSS